MYAEVGDWLVLSGDHQRIGLIVCVPHADGTPPYVVKWRATGHIAMVMPGQFARIRQADQAAAPPPAPSDSGPSAPGPGRWSRATRTAAG